MTTPQKPFADDRTHIWARQMFTVLFSAAAPAPPSGWHNFPDLLSSACGLADDDMETAVSANRRNLTRRGTAPVARSKRELIPRDHLIHSVGLSIKEPAPWASFAFGSL